MPYDITAIVNSGATIIWNGQPLGYTKDACTQGRERDHLRINDIQQISGDVDDRQLKGSITIKINLYEFTLENIRLAWGLKHSIVNDTESNTKRLKIDISGQSAFGELIIYGKGENNVNRTVKYYRTKIIDCGDINYDAYGATIIPITILVLLHPQHGTELGEVWQDYVPSGTVLD